MSARHVQTFGLVVLFAVLLSPAGTTAVTRGRLESFPRSGCGPIETLPSMRWRK